MEISCLKMKFLGGQHWLLVDVVYHLLSTNCQVTVYHMLTAYLSIFTYLFIILTRHELFLSF